MRPFLLSFFALALAFRSTPLLAYIVLESDHHEFFVLATVGQETILQGCGYRPLPIQTFQDGRSLEETLSACREMGGGDAGTTPAANYIVSIQSEYGVPWALNSPTAFVELTNQRLKDVSEGVPDEERLIQIDALEKVTAAYREILNYLGTDHHRTLSRIKEAGLYIVARNGFFTIYHDGERAWTLSGSNTFTNSILPCTGTWSSSSADTILNSPKLNELARWYRQVAPQSGGNVLAYYRWNEVSNVPEGKYLTAHGRHISFGLDKPLLDWKRNHPERVPAIGAEYTEEDKPAVLRWFDELGGTGDSDQAPGQYLCQRRYFPPSIPRSRGNGTIPLPKAIKNWTHPQVALAFGAMDSEIERLVAPYAIWSEDLLPEMTAAQVSQLLDNRLGRNDPKIDEAVRSRMAKSSPAPAAASASASGNGASVSVSVGGNPYSVVVVNGGVSVTTTTTVTVTTTP